MKKLKVSEKQTLNLIRVKGLLSISQISELINISISNVTKIIKELDKNKFIDEVEGASTGGRIPKKYKIKDDIYYSLGLEINDKHLKGVITNTNGDIVDRLAHDIYFKEKRYILFSDIIDFSNEILKRNGFTWEKIATMGLGIGGMVNEENGYCIYFPNKPEWENFEIVNELKKESKIPNIFLTDKVRAMTLAESCYGVANEFSNFILFYVGDVIGAGIMINKNIITGLNGIAGEIGHVRIDDNKEMCLCGSYGCLEATSSARAIIRKIENGINMGVYTSISNSPNQENDIDLPKIREALISGDKFVLNVVEDAMHNIAISISTLSNLLNPEAIVLAGEFVDELGDLVMENLIKDIKAIVIPWLRKGVNIKKSNLGPFMAPLGAARLALDNLFR